MEDLSEIRKVLRENPNDPQALRGAANYYLRESYYREAQNLFAQAAAFGPRLVADILLDYERQIEREPEKIGPRLSLAGFLLCRGEVDSAILELEEALEVDPHNVEVYNALGRIYLKQDRISDAITVLERSISEGVRDVNLTEILAAAYLEKGRVSEAISFYEEIAKQKPGDKQTLRILGELYTRTERYLEAARCYQAMFSDDPEVVREVIQRLEDLLKKVEGSIEIREIIADIYMKTLNPEAAVEKLQQILRLEPTKLDDTIQKLRSILRSYPHLPSAVLALAEALRRQGNFSEAVENYYQLAKSRPELIPQAIQGYNEVIECCPDQVLARSYLAEALLAQNQVEAALQRLEEIVEVDPSAAEHVIRRTREVLKSYPQLLQAHVVLGRAYLAKGDYQRAAMEAEGVIALNRKETSAYLLLGEAYGRLNLKRKAFETIRLALFQDPYNGRVIERYREVKRQEVEEEIASLKARIEEDHWKISLHLDLARLYLQSGQREEAIRELQLAQKDTASVPLACNLLGNIYRSEGRYDLAAAQYNRALEAFSGGHADLLKTIRFNLGSALEAQGEVRRAIKVYEAILQEDVDFGGLKKRIKRLRSTSLQSMRAKSLQMVISEYGKADIVALWGREAQIPGRSGKKEEINVSFGQGHNQEGFDYFMKGMYQAAEEEFNLASQIDRRFGAALNNLGVVLARSGRIEEARLKLIEATEVDPASVVFYNNLGVIYFLLGKTESARSALEKSFALDPESAAVCLNLGDLYYQSKEIQKAIDFYRKVGAFDPLSDIAEQRLFYLVP